MKMYFQDIILTLQDYWAKQGCVIEQPLGVECGAGTLILIHFLRVIGPEPWKVAYVELLASTNGWSIRRKSQSPPTLFSISGHYETFSTKFPGALSE